MKECIFHVNEFDDDYYLICFEPQNIIDILEWISKKE